MTILCLYGCTNKGDEKKFSLNQTQEKIIESQDQKEMNKITLEINQKEFQVTLVKNNAVEQLLLELPMSMEMNDLNRNEKYYYFNHSIPTKSESVGHIEVGDFMLFGDNCLVLFYDSFDTSYSYTRLGHVDNVDEFVKTVGNTNIKVIMNRSK
jgi:Uncharacterized conserved protein